MLDQRVRNTNFNEQYNSVSQNSFFFGIPNLFCLIFPHTIINSWCSKAASRKSSNHTAENSDSFTEKLYFNGSKPVIKVQFHTCNNWTLQRYKGWYFFYKRYMMIKGLQLSVCPLQSGIWICPERKKKKILLVFSLTKVHIGFYQEKKPPPHWSYTIFRHPFTHM